MKTKTKKKRNPTDATMRNINALRKRVKRLEDYFRALNSYGDKSNWYIEALKKKGF